MLSKNFAKQSQQFFFITHKLYLTCFYPILQENGTTVVLSLPYTHKWAITVAFQNFCLNIVGLCNKL